MKRLKLLRSISLNSIFIYAALFCVASFALLEHVSISIGAFSPVKLQLMYVGFFCILTQIKTIFRCVLKKKYFFQLLAVFFFCAMLCLSMMANLHSSMGMQLYNTVRVLLYIVEMYALMIVLAETGRVQSALKFLFWYTFLIVVANDVLMFSGTITFGTKRYENYLVGTKFDVSYLHMTLLTLWIMCYARDGKRMRIARWMVILATAFISIVALRTSCVTGLLGCLILGVVFALLESTKGKVLLKLTSPSLLMLAISASVIFAIVAETIVSIPMIEYFVEHVLNRNTSLTGRTNIYEVFVAKTARQWVQGYGFGYGDEIAESLFGYANVQNGLLQWVMEVGLLGTSGFLVLLVQVFRQLKHSEAWRRMRAMPMVVLVYLYVVLATVEITFNMAFLMWFAIIFMLVTERKTTVAK